MTADLLAALKAVLAADADVAALAGARVYGDELPGTETVAMPRKAVVLQNAGGTPLVSGTAGVSSQRIDAVCYGETPFEADRLRRAVLGALGRLRRTVAAGVLVHWAGEAAGATAARDADANWPISVQPFDVFFALTEVA